MAVSGVGQMKLARYADDFLNLLRTQGDAAYQETEGEREKPRESSPAEEGENDWGIYENTMLEARVLGGMSIEEIAGEHNRSVEEIKKRLSILGYDLG